MRNSIIQCSSDFQTFWVSGEVENTEIVCNLSSLETSAKSQSTHVLKYLPELLNILATREWWCSMGSYCAGGQLVWWWAVIVMGQLLWRRRVTVMAGSYSDGGKLTWWRASSISVRYSPSWNLRAPPTPFWPPRSSYAFLT